MRWVSSTLLFIALNLQKCIYIEGLSLSEDDLADDE